MFLILFTHPYQSISQVVEGDDLFGRVQGSGQEVPGSNPVFIWCMSFSKTHLLLRVLVWNLGNYGSVQTRLLVNWQKRWAWRTELYLPGIIDHPHITSAVYKFQSHDLSPQTTIKEKVKLQRLAESRCQYVMKLFSGETRYDPRREKTSLQGSLPGLTQTGLCSYSRWLEAWNFRFR